MFEENYDYVTVNVDLGKNTILGVSPIDIPHGKVVVIGAVTGGDTQNRVIDLGIFKNNNAVIQPADVRFSAKTNGGTFKDSMRPVSFSGGGSFEARLIAYDPSATEDIKVQVIFMIDKNTQ